MQMYSKFLVLLALSAILITPAHSATNQVKTDRTMSLIQVYEVFAVVWFTPSFNNSLCPGPKNAAVIDWSVNKDAKAMFATVLMSYSSAKPVRFCLKDPCHPWGAGVPQIYRLDAQP